MTHAPKFWAAYVAAVAPSRVPSFWLEQAAGYSGESSAYAALYGLQWDHAKAHAKARQACAVNKNI